MKRTAVWLMLVSCLSLHAQDGRKKWRVANLRRGPRQYALLVAGPDQRRELQSASKSPGDSRPRISGPRPETNLQSTPLMVNGVLYSTAGSRRAVIALDAGTGELLWTHSEKEGKRGDNAARTLSGRGLAYWSDGTEERILYVTPGYRLDCAQRQDRTAGSGIRPAMASLI